MGAFRTGLQLLEMFENASKMMSGEKYPTLSFVMPIFIELFTFIERQVQVPEDGLMLVSMLPIRCLQNTILSQTTRIIIFLLCSWTRGSKENTWSEKDLISITQVSSSNPFF